LGWTGKLLETGPIALRNCRDFPADPEQ